MRFSITSLNGRNSLVIAYIHIYKRNNNNSNSNKNNWLMTRESIHGVSRYRSGVCHFVRSKGRWVVGHMSEGIILPSRRVWWWWYPSYISIIFPFCKILSSSSSCFFFSSLNLLTTTTGANVPSWVKKESMSTTCLLSSAIARGGKGVSGRVMWFRYRRYSTCVNYSFCLHAGWTTVRHNSHNHINNGVCGAPTNTSCRGTREPNFSKAPGTGMTKSNGLNMYSQRIRILLQEAIESSEMHCLCLHKDSSSTCPPHGSPPSRLLPSPCVARLFSALLETPLDPLLSSFFSPASTASSVVKGEKYPGASSPGLLHPLLCVRLLNFLGPSLRWMYPSLPVGNTITGSTSISFPTSSFSSPTPLAEEVEGWGSERNFPLFLSSPLSCSSFSMSPRASTFHLDNRAVPVLLHILFPLLHGCFLGKVKFSEGSEEGDKMMSPHQNEEARTNHWSSSWELCALPCSSSSTTTASIKDNLPRRHHHQHHLFFSPPPFLLFSQLVPPHPQVAPHLGLIWEWLWALDQHFEPTEKKLRKHLQRPQEQEEVEEKGERRRREGCTNAHHDDTVSQEEQEQKESCASLIPQCTRSAWVKKISQISRLPWVLQRSQWLPLYLFFLQEKHPVLTCSLYEDSPEISSFSSLSSSSPCSPTSSSSPEADRTPAPTMAVGVVADAGKGEHAQRREGMVWSTMGSVPPSPPLPLYPSMRHVVPLLLAEELLPALDTLLPSSSSSSPPHPMRLPPREDRLIRMMHHVLYLWWWEESHTHSPTTSSLCSAIAAAPSSSYSFPPPSLTGEGRIVEGGRGETALTTGAGSSAGGNSISGNTRVTCSPSASYSSLKKDVERMERGRRGGASALRSATSSWWWLAVGDALWWGRRHLLSSSSSSSPNGNVATELYEGKEKENSDTDPLQTVVDHHLRYHCLNDFHKEKEWVVSLEKEVDQDISHFPSSLFSRISSSAMEKPLLYHPILRDAVQRVGALLSHFYPLPPPSPSYSSSFRGIFTLPISIPNEVMWRRLLLQLAGCPPSSLSLFSSSFFPVVEHQKKESCVKEEEKEVVVYVSPHALCFSLSAEAVKEHNVIQPQYKGREGEVHETPMGGANNGVLVKEEEKTNKSKEVNGADPQMVSLLSSAKGLKSGGETSQFPTKATSGEVKVAQSGKIKAESRGGGMGEADFLLSRPPQDSRIDTLLGGNQNNESKTYDRAPQPFIKERKGKKHDFLGFIIPLRDFFQTMMRCNEEDKHLCPRAKNGRMNEKQPCSGTSNHNGETAIAFHYTSSRAVMASAGVRLSPFALGRMIGNMVKDMDVLHEEGCKYSPIGRFYEGVSQDQKMNDKTCPSFFGEGNSASYTDIYPPEAFTLLPHSPRVHALKYLTDLLYENLSDPFISSSSAGTAATTTTTTTSTPNTWTDSNNRNHNSTVDKMPLSSSSGYSSSSLWTNHHHHTTQEGNLRSPLLLQYLYPLSTQKEKEDQKGRRKKDTKNNSENEEENFKEQGEKHHTRNERIEMEMVQEDKLKETHGRGLSPISIAESQLCKMTRKAAATEFLSTLSKDITSSLSSRTGEMNFSSLVSMIWRYRGRARALVRALMEEKRVSIYQERVLRRDGTLLPLYEEENMRHKWARSEETEDDTVYDTGDPGLRNRTAPSSCSCSPTPVRISVAGGGVTGGFRTVLEAGGVLPSWKTRPVLGKEKGSFHFREEGHSGAGCNGNRENASIVGRSGSNGEEKGGGRAGVVREGGDDVGEVEAAAIRTLRNAAFRLLEPSIARWYVLQDMWERQRLSTRVQVEGKEMEKGRGKVKMQTSCFLSTFNASSSISHFLIWQFLMSPLSRSSLSRVSHRTLQTTWTTLVEAGETLMDILGVSSKTLQPSCSSSLNKESTLLVPPHASGILDGSAGGEAIVRDIQSFLALPLTDSLVKVVEGIRLAGLLAWWTTTRQWQQWGKEQGRRCLHPPGSKERGGKAEFIPASAEMETENSLQRMRRNDTSSLIREHNKEEKMRSPSFAFSDVEAASALRCLPLDRVANAALCVWHRSQEQEEEEEKELQENRMIKMTMTVEEMDPYYCHAVYNRGGRGGRGEESARSIKSISIKVLLVSLLLYRTHVLHECVLAQRTTADVCIASSSASSVAFLARRVVKSPTFRSLVQAVSCIAPPPAPPAALTREGNKRRKRNGEGVVRDSKRNCPLHGDVFTQYFSKRGVERSDFSPSSPAYKRRRIADVLWSPTAEWHVLGLEPLLYGVHLCGSRFAKSKGSPSGGNDNHHRIKETAPEEVGNGCSGGKPAESQEQEEKKRLKKPSTSFNKHPRYRTHLYYPPMTSQRPSSLSLFSSLDRRLASFTHGAAGSGMGGGSEGCGGIDELHEFVQSFHDIYRSVLATREGKRCGSRREAFNPIKGKSNSKVEDEEEGVGETGSAECLWLGTPSSILTAADICQKWKRERAALRDLPYYSLDQISNDEREVEGEGIYITKTDVLIFAIPWSTLAERLSPLRLYDEGGASERRRDDVDVGLQQLFSLATQNEDTEDILIPVEEEEYKDGQDGADNDADNLKVERNVAEVGENELCGDGKEDVVYSPASSRGGTGKAPIRRFTRVIIAIRLVSLKEEMVHILPAGPWRPLSSISAFNKKGKHPGIPSHPFLSSSTASLNCSISEGESNNTTTSTTSTTINPSKTSTTSSSSLPSSSPFFIANYVPPLLCLPPVLSEVPAVNQIPSMMGNTNGAKDVEKKNIKPSTCAGRDDPSSCPYFILPLSPSLEFISIGYPTKVEENGFCLNN